MPRIVWSAIVWELFRLGQPLMGIQILCMVVSYARPGELLNSLRGDLIPPLGGVSSGWSIILHPMERMKASKTQSYDDTITMKNEIYPFIGKILEKLIVGPKAERIFSHGYVDFARCFRQACLRLGLRDVVPYQCRHSGASIDRAGCHRCLSEVKKRGRWRSDASVARYEKAGRLALEVNKVPEALRYELVRATAQLEHSFAQRFVPPSGPSGPPGGESSSRSSQALGAPRKRSIDEVIPSSPGTSSVARPPTFCDPRYRKSYEVGWLQAKSGASG